MADKQLIMLGVNDFLDGQIFHLVDRPPLLALFHSDGYVWWDTSGGFRSRRGLSKSPTRLTIPAAADCLREDSYFRKTIVINGADVGYIHIPSNGWYKREESGFFSPCSL